MIIYKLSHVLTYIIASSILAFGLGWFAHYLRTHKDRKQYRNCEKVVKDLNATVAEIGSQLSEQKDINDQVRAQIFAEREAGEDTINRLYIRIQNFRKENQQLKDQLRVK